MKTVSDTGLCLLSAFLLILAFPLWDAGYLAWAALAPLFWVLLNREPWGGFLLAFIWGNCFFLGIFNWILEIPDYRWYHHAFLSLYLGSYIGVFGIGFVFIKNRRGRTAALWAAPFLWVALEYLRGNMSFLALPWGFIGHTQYQYPVAIQSVSLVGTYGLSFMMVLVNAAVLILIQRCGYCWKRGRTQPGEKSEAALLILSGLGLLFIFSCSQQIDWKPLSGAPLSVSLVQGNIEQSKKWDPNYADDIMAIYSELTLEASAAQPDLIVWPETATPGSITSDGALFDRVTDLAQKTGTPLLLGSAEHQKFQEADSTHIRSTNSAFLIHPSKEGTDLQAHDKIRLFPFGEYLPYNKILPWKWIHVSSMGDYVSGNAHTLFQLSSHHFAVTICWENIFPDLVRHFVEKGAQFIVNITNEARFGKTAAPYQLMAISVFRAVENRIYMLRCTNTGISCIIDPYGRIVRRLRDPHKGDLFIEGVITGEIEGLNSNTFYTRYGAFVPTSTIAGCGLFFLFSRKRSYSIFKKERRNA